MSRIKNYFLKNYTAIAIGFSIAIVFMQVLQIIESIVSKLLILKYN